MKKVFLTLVLSLIFIATSNAQVEPEKKETETTSKKQTIEKVEEIKQAEIVEKKSEKIDSAKENELDEISDPNPSNAPLKSKEDEEETPRKEEE